MSGVLAVLAAAGQGAPGIINTSLPNGSSNIGSGAWSLQNDGTYAISLNGGVQTGNWVTPASAPLAALYQIKVDVTAGSFSTGTTGSFLDLSSTRSWTITGAGGATFTVTIREKATGLVRSVQTGKTLVVA